MSIKLKPKKDYSRYWQYAKEKAPDDRLALFLSVIEPYNKEWERQQKKQTSIPFQQPDE